MILPPEITRWHGFNSPPLDPGIRVSMKLKFQVFIGVVFLVAVAMLVRGLTVQGSSSLIPFILAVLGFGATGMMVLGMWRGPRNRD